MPVLYQNEIRSIGDLAYVSHVTPQQFGAVADGVADDGPKINLAITAAKTLGAAVYFPAGTYRVRTMINVNGDNIRLFGAGMGKSVIKVFGESTPMNRVIGHTANVSNLTVSDLTFLGTAVDDAPNPRRSRTFTSNGFNSALQVSGDLAPSVSTVVRNITVDRVEVIGSHGLPMLFSGVRGVARVDLSRSYNTMDWGWTWCESAVVTNSVSERGSDNGFSLSRGCTSVVAVGNYVDGCAYYGIWVSGFNVTGVPTDCGPKNFIVAGNVVKRAGRGGIHADMAPENGSITGNTVVSVQRGDSDTPSNLVGVGIWIGGFPDTNRVAPDFWARNISISGNTLVDCARGGIMVAGAKVVSVTNNLIVRPGTQYLADGTTVIATNDLDQNFGVTVLNGAQATTERLSIMGNTMVDDRATPYMNYPWYTSGSPNAYVSNNREQGSRQSATLTHDNGTGINHSGIHIWTASQRYSAGAVAGSNAGTGTVAGFDINGAAGSTRLHQYQTAGLTRWTERVTADAESGSNAGSNFAISSYTDAGVLVKHMIQMTRDGKIGFNGANPVAPSALGAAATDAASALALANNIRSALIALGLATA
ncbi:hypothetical protein CH265_08050 [Rhodococcus sp. 05-2221-1B]|nr:hypothetical protein CH265_08050 [Rhodococcus sp. 05-2221-1B]